VRRPILFRFAEISLRTTSDANSSRTPVFRACRIRMSAVNSSGLNSFLASPLSVKICLYHRMASITQKAPDGKAQLLIAGL
jgi:hypothetical protein